MGKGMKVSYNHHLQKKTQDGGKKVTEKGNHKIEKCVIAEKQNIKKKKLKLKIRKALQPHGWRESR